MTPAMYVIRHDLVDGLDVTRCSTPALASHPPAFATLAFSCCLFKVDSCARLRHTITAVCHSDVTVVMYRDESW